MIDVEYWICFACSFHPFFEFIKCKLNKWLYDLLFFSRTEIMHIQWNLSVADTISTSEECPLHRMVCYKEVILAYFASQLCSRVLGDSAIDSKVCQETGVGRSPKTIYSREYHVYHEVKKSINKINKEYFCCDSY